MVKNSSWNQRYLGSACILPHWWCVSKGGVARSLPKHLIFEDWILFLSSAIKGHVSQVHRKVNLTRKAIRLIESHMLSFYSILVFLVPSYLSNPSQYIWFGTNTRHDRSSRYLKLFDVSSLVPFMLIPSSQKIWVVDHHFCLCIGLGWSCQDNQLDHSNVICKLAVHKYSCFKCWHSLHDF